MFYLLCLLLDYIDEDLFNARERIIQISCEKDLLFDSVVELKEKLSECRAEKEKLQKQFNALFKLHSKCRTRNIILYR